MSNEQKLREALCELMHIVSIHQRATRNNFAWAEMAFAREALALPTADHFPDATKMIEAAAPVGERELFERTMMDKYGWQNEDFKLDDFGYFDGQTDTAWMAWQARAALSAGDAVDAQRWRYAMDWGTKDFAVCMRVGATGVCWDPIKTDGPIDTAMRKGQI